MTDPNETDVTPEERIDALETQVAELVAVVARLEVARERCVTVSAGAVGLALFRLDQDDRILKGSAYDRAREELRAAIAPALDAAKT